MSGAAPGLDDPPDRTVPDRAVSADVFERMVEIRRELHRHPELSWEETATAERIEGWLDALGIGHARMCGTGVVADLPGPAGVPRVALRADTDALPITEANEVSYRSTHDGVMHACGHDGHTAMLLGAAELLLREPSAAPVRLVFQPAEEVGNGARAMMDAGVLDGVGIVFGGHLDWQQPAGTILVTDGAVSASTDTFRIRVAGRPGHAARPHEVVDALLAASHVVVALQSIVAREVDPADPAVVTVGKLEAGRVSNVIAGRAEMEGTVRAQSPSVREGLLSAVRRVATTVAEAHRAHAEVEIERGTPVLVNPLAETRLARRAATDIVGDERVASLPRPNMAGEDFSLYLSEVPGCYVRYGAALTDGGHPTHSNRFDFDEEALAVGAAWLARVARVAGERLAET